MVHTELAGVPDHDVNELRIVRRKMFVKQVDELK